MLRYAMSEEESVRVCVELGRVRLPRTLLESLRRLGELKEETLRRIKEIAGAYDEEHDGVWGSVEDYVSESLGIGDLSSTPIEELPEMRLSEDGSEVIVMKPWAPKSPSSFYS